jgi:hypothetical protein
MRLKWIRFASFILLFSLIFSVANFSMRIENKRWMDLYNLPPDSVDVVFMGNSHSFVAFQPQIIDQILPVKSYVVGIGGENIVLSYYELKELLRYQHPKVVVLETFVLDLNDAYMPTENYYDFLDSGGWSANKTAVAERYLTPDTLYTLFPALRQRMEWDKPYLYLQCLADEWNDMRTPTLDPAAGASPMTAVLSEADYAAYRVTTVESYPQPSEEITLYLDMFLTLCQQNDIQLILTTMPMVNQPQITNGRYAPFDAAAYAREHDLPLLTYDAAAFNHLHFAQVDHVNTFGSLYVSVEMANELAAVMGYSVDQAKLAAFQSMEFSDYSLSTSNGDYTIRLTPTDPAAALEYRWTVSGEGGTVVESAWQEDSAYTFRLPHDGKYSVHVEIRSREGSLRLAADFPVLKQD